MTGDPKQQNDPDDTSDLSESTDSSNGVEDGAESKGPDGEVNVAALEPTAAGPVKIDAKVDSGIDSGIDSGEGVAESDLLSRLESLIFVSPEPISVRRLARVLSVPGKRIRELLARLTEHYETRGIVLQEISGGFQFRSHPENARIVRAIFKLRPLRISRAALEALSIVAYRQPLTRAEVEQIRGVDSGGVLKYLFEKGLVRIIGRKDEPGRPMIYGTSSTFLELFGLKSLSDLPALHEFSELWDEHQEIVDTEAPEENDSQDSEEGDDTGHPADIPAESDVEGGEE